MSELAFDPTLIDWKGADGLDYRAKWKGGALVFKARIRGLRDLVVWASGKSNYFISKVLNWVYNATAFTPPATLQFALWTATLDKTSTGVTAGEASYSGYARVAVTANTTNFPTSSSGGNIQNATAITFASKADVGTQTMTYLAVLDSATIGAGNIIYWGALSSSAAITQGVTPQIDINGLTASEA